MGGDILSDKRCMLYYSTATLDHFPSDDSFRLNCRVVFFSFRLAKVLKKWGSSDKTISLKETKTDN